MIEPASRILIIETSSRWGSAALGTPEGIIASGVLDGPMRHAADFHPLIDRLFREQGWVSSSLTHAFVSIGPGSFTGLRIGVSIARTLGWSIGTKVVAVSTLDCVARNALRAQPVPEHVAVLLDAKREQVYAAAYRVRASQIERLSGPVLVSPASYLAGLPRPLAVIGEGIPHHQATIQAAGVQVLDSSLWIPDVAAVFTLGMAMANAGEFTPSSDLIPLYVRRPEAEEKWEKLHPPKGEQSVTQK